MELPPPWLLAWLAAANLVGLAAVVHDKRRARRAGRRVPEAALLALALLGGWPGELVAMLAVRHKTRKAAFLVPFALAAVASVLLVLALVRGVPG